MFALNLNLNMHFKYPVLKLGWKLFGYKFKKNKNIVFGAIRKITFRKLC